jgi:hypothetical protein
MKTRTTLLWLAVTAAVVLGLAGSCTPFNPLAAAGVGVVRIFWVTRYDIWSANLDGTDKKHLVHEDPASTSWFSALAVDPVDRKIYWTETTFNRIYRADLDGTGAVMLVEGIPANSEQLAVDAAGGKVYYGSPEGLWRCGLNGGNPEEITASLASLGLIQAMAIDPVHRRLYWTDDNQVYYAPLPTGTDLTGTISAFGPPATGTIDGLDVDGTAGIVYWAIYGAFEMVTVSASSPAELVISVSPDYTAKGFAVDPFGRTVYWAEDVGSALVKACDFGSAADTTIMEDPALEIVEDIDLYLGP